MTTVAAIVLALLLPVQRPEVQTVLANVRRAVQFEKLQALPRGAHLTGTGVFFGEAGTYDSLFSASGEFVETVTGPLGAVHAFDGTVAWESDWTGATRTLALRDREILLASMAIQTGTWLGEKGPFVIAVNDARTNTDRVALDLKVRNGVHQTTLLIDRKSWLPLSESYEGAAGLATTSFSDWRPSVAGLVPHRVESSEGGLTNTTSVASVEPAPVFVRNPYERLPWKAVDTTFDAAAPAQVEMKRAFTGHILVHPLVNGKDVGWFILDSGAGSMVVDRSVADEIGMPKIGEIPVVGVGGLVKGHFRPSDTFTLGPITIRNLKFVEIDLAQLSTIFQTKIAGMAGYDVFRRAIVTLDLDGKRLGIEDPARHRLLEGKWQALILDGKHPIVECSYEGERKGMFRIDTGAAGTVTFGGALAKTLTRGRTTRPTMMGGVGGLIQARTGAMEWFELAGHRFENPEVTFMTERENALANEHLAGNIGQDFLLPFTLVFDYGGDRIAFVPKPSGADASRRDGLRSLVPALPCGRG